MSNVNLKNNNIFKMKLQNGARGLSAYEIWIGLGNTGSEEDFINSLKIDGGSNYINLINKPRIATVELVGDKSFEDLGMQSITEVEIRNLF